MNKAEAAKYLNKSPRAVVRYAVQHKLSVRKTIVTGADGRAREVSDYDEEELKALKAELDMPTQTISPRVERNVAVVGKPVDVDMMNEFSERTAVAVASAIAELLARTPPAALMLEAKKATKRKPTKRKPNPAQIAYKLLLTIDEASALGVPRKQILEAIESGTLAAIETTDGARIKRTAFDSYIKKL